MNVDYLRDELSSFQPMAVIIDYFEDVQFHNFSRINNPRFKVLDVVYDNELDQVHLILDYVKDSYDKGLTAEQVITKVHGIEGDTAVFGSHSTPYTKTFYNILEVEDIGYGRGTLHLDSDYRYTVDMRFNRESR